MASAVSSALVLVLHRYALWRLLIFEKHEYCFFNLTMEKKMSKAFEFGKTGLAGVLLLSVAACQQNPKVEDSNYTRVTASELPALYGKTLTLDGNSMTVSADGTLGGTWGGQPMAGTWDMDDDYFCRVLTEFFKPERTGTEDCQLWELQGNKLRSSRDKGKGNSFTFTIN